MLNHSALYLLARGAPGILNFLALALYTRFLLPEDYGRYGLIIAGVSFLNALTFNWLRVGLGRFYPAHLKDPQVLLSTLAFGLLGMIAVTSIAGVIAIVFWPDPSWRSLVSLGVVLLWAQAWFEMNLELARAQLSPGRYGIISFLKSVLALSIGLGLVFVGFKAHGPLLGLIIGMLAVSLLSLKYEWQQVRLNKVDFKLGKELAQYGLPLTGIAVLSFLIASSDRFILNHISGVESAGLYSAAYDIADQSLGVLMMIVNLAAIPLAFRALELHGVQAAKEQLRENIIMLLAVALPAAAGFVLCAPNIAEVVLGEHFREAAKIIIPWIVLAALIAGIKAHYIDLSFFLSKKTLAHMWIVAFTALVNIALNFLWIPSSGVLGAAYATVIAYLIGAVLSVIVGRRVFPIPMIPKEAWKIVLCTVIMSLSLWPLLSFSGVVALISQVAVGGAVYCVFFIMFNIAESKTTLKSLLNARKVKINQ